MLEAAPSGLTRNLSLRDLRYILAISEELHFGRAAERLGIALPQLSEIVRRIERDAQFRLFTRRPRVALTPAGEIVVGLARRALNQVDRTIAHARAVASGTMGTVSIGISEAAKLTNLPRVLKSFRERSPDIRLNLLEGSSSKLWDMLERRAVELIVTDEMRKDRGAISVPIMRYGMMLLLPEGHILAARPGPIALRDLSEESFVLFRRSNAPLLYDQIMRACHAAGLVPNVVQEVDSVSLIFALVRAGLGISFEHAQAKQFYVPGVRLHEISDEVPGIVLWLSCSREALSASGTLLRDLLLSSFEPRDDVPGPAC